MLYCALPLLLLAAQASARGLGAHGRATAQLEHSDRKDGRRISPSLEPASDKKFFKGDYPFDKRPAADKYYVFNHPYPAVQDSGDFDKDFVKDENSDGGRWKAQMEYDTLRSQIQEAKDKLDELQKKMDGEKEEWMKAKKAQDDAETYATEAGQDVAAAKKAADKAAEEVNKLEGSSREDGTKIGGEIGDAVGDVQKDMKTLDECRKELAKAKARMKTLMKEKEEMDKKKKQIEEEDKKKEEEEKKKKEEEEKEEAAAEASGKTGKTDAKGAKGAKGSKAGAEEDESSWSEEKWEKKLDDEKAEHASAQKSYEEEVKELKKTEDELARAADNLRKYRRPPYVDDDGGVYNVPKNSDATRLQLGLAAVACIVASFTF